MNIFMMAAFVLFWGTQAIDRWVYKIPNWMALVLYAIAILLLVAGMIMRRKAGS